MLWLLSSKCNKVFTHSFMHALGQHSQARKSKMHVSYKLTLLNMNGAFSGLLKADIPSIIWIPWKILSCLSSLHLHFFSFIWVTLMVFRVIMLVLLICSETQKNYTSNWSPNRPPITFINMNHFTTRASEEEDQ